jgi:hypothetical protein
LRSIKQRCSHFGSPKARKSRFNDNKIKLKRKLTYKGHYQYQYVHTQKIQNAIACLKHMNKWYKDIDFNPEWENPLQKDACSVLKECNPVNDTPSAPERGHYNSIRPGVR